MMISLVVSVTACLLSGAVGFACGYYQGEEAEQQRWTEREAAMIKGMCEEYLS